MTKWINTIGSAFMHWLAHLQHKPETSNEPKNKTRRKKLLIVPIIKNKVYFCPTKKPIMDEGPYQSKLVY